MNNTLHRNRGKYRIMLGLVLGLVGCGGYSDEATGSEGCPVALAPTDAQLLVALEAIDEWNGPRLGCQATINPMGVTLDDSMDVRDVKALIADLVCEVAPC